ncbi:hypothetical protein CSUI_001954 [Cystoisospora suis]|uniref:Uncharacterized protein n=1 Tax=Cystoisospora suis TaxID=483139 RepID=A0A2C6LAK9_9APIC|nr:hypothetical protein CSUI_001954 [Cystoisospora suis]
MGQDQSQVLTDEQLDDVQIRRRQRDEMRSTKKKKPPFMKHTDAPNHIRPIREAAKEKAKKDDGFEGTFEIQGLGVKKKKREEEFKVEGKLVDLPDYHVSESESSGSDDEDRGVYHHEVSSKRKDNSLPITDPEAHPVIIEGECVVGKELRIVDKSSFSREFPITRIEWYLGSEINNHNYFLPHCSKEGGSSTSFTVPPDALGRFILAKVYRNVEDQLHDTQYSDEKAGVFDPHIGGTRHTDYRPPPKIVKVCTSAIAGPALMADSWAYVCLKALSRGAFSCAIKLRDVSKSGGGGHFDALDGAKASSKAFKVPGTLLVERDLLELSYQPRDLLHGGEDIGNLFDLLQGGGPGGLGMGGADLMTSKKKGKKNDGKADDKPALKKFFVPLAQVYLRPSKGPNTIVAALEYRPLDGKREGRQDIIRFDVDPAVGRDVALYTVISFQAALSRRRLNTAEWQEYAQVGDLDQVKYLVQEHLEFLTSRAAEEAPAYEKMPTTPWSILNKPQEDSEDDDV